jgi:hypothetical protein
MAKKRKPKQTVDITSPTQEKKSNKGGYSYSLRHSSLLITLAIACALPVIIFIVITATTSDQSSYKYNINGLKTSVQQIKASTPGAFFKIKPDGQTVTFIHHITDQRNYSQLDLDIYVDRRIPSAFLLFGKKTEKQMNSIRISNQLTRAGWNKIHISFDEHQNLHGSDTVGLAFKAEKNTTVIGIRAPSLTTYSFLQRVKNQFKSLSRNQPLKNSSINFIKSQKIIGYGFTFIFWLSLILGLILLAVRKFLFKEKFQFLIHAAVISLIYFVMIDIRNSIDLTQNAYSTTKEHLESADFCDRLTSHERKYTWFGDLTEWLQKELPQKKSYFIDIGKHLDPYKVVQNRVGYYGRPAHRVKNIDKAAYTVLIGSSRKMPETQWRKKQSFNYAEVYERIK